MIHDSICGLIDNKVCARRACVIGLHFTVLANLCHWFTLHSACQLVSWVYTLQLYSALTCVIGLHFTHDENDAVITAS